MIQTRLLHEETPFKKKTVSWSVVVHFKSENVCVVYCYDLVYLVYGFVWYGMVWYVMVCYGMLLYVMVYYGMLRFWQVFGKVCVGFGMVWFARVSV